MTQEKLVDVAAERAVIAGLFHCGIDAYVDVMDFIQSDTFTDPANQALYSCFVNLYDQKKINKADQASVISVATELGHHWLFDKPDEAKYVRSIFNMQIGKENIRIWAAKIRKLQIARLLVNQLNEAGKTVEDIKGNESITQILGIAESAIFDFTSLLRTDNNNDPSIMGDGISDYIDNIESNPKKIVGISSGYSLYDQAIGGGFRRKTVSLIGARSKAGKSMLALNIGLHIASNNIPVLYLDTEMSKEDQWSRAIPNVVAKTGDGVRITINELESGSYIDNGIKKRKVREATEKIKALPFHYLNVSGKPFEEILSIVRRWLHRVVGHNPDGTTKDCIVLYDYLKMMSADGLQDLKEYQIMGFMTTSLHNFCVHYDIPILCFIQLNRDGIDKESQDIISQSDRILWLVTNFSLYKAKSDLEIADSGINCGTRKLIPLSSRHGEGLPPNEYINMVFEGKYALITEGKLRSQSKYDNTGNNDKQPPPIQDADNIPMNDE